MTSRTGAQMMRSEPIRYAGAADPLKAVTDAAPYVCLASSPRRARLLPWHEARFAAMWIAFVILIGREHRIRSAERTRAAVVEPPVREALTTARISRSGATVPRRSGSASSPAPTGPARSRSAAGSSRGRDDGRQHQHEADGDRASPAPPERLARTTCDERRRGRATSRKTPRGTALAVPTVRAEDGDNRRFGRPRDGDRSRPVPPTQADG